MVDHEIWNVFSSPVNYPKQAMHRLGKIEIKLPKVSNAWNE
jgi:hypothetical protein